MPSTSTYPWAGRKESDDGSNGIDLKQKDSPGGLCMSPADSPFLVSPAVRYTPYFGQFGVSATTVSPSGSSVSMLCSPLTTSPNHIGAEKPPTRIPSQMNQSYMCQNQPPILSAPSLFSLRPATGVNPEYGRNPLQHGLLQPAPLRSTTHLPSLDTMRPLPRRRKRKPVRAFSERDLSGEMTPEEQILMQLTEQKNLPWKEVAIRFKEQTGKMMKIPALQMKKKRLVERLRVWTPSEEQALYMAWEEYSRSKWEIIANNMPKYGCAEKWPKELVQKKLQGTSDLTTTHGRCHVL